MKKILPWLIKAVAAGLAALLLLNIWCYFYFNVPVHYTNETGATEYKWESHKFYRKGTEGFAFGRTNNDGFTNLSDYEPGQEIEILLMGSSHMEGMNVPQEDNTANLLNLLFEGEKYTYNIGTSITREDFEAGRLIAAQIFLFVNRSLAPDAPLRTVDSGMYACLYLDNYDDESNGARRLLDWCRENGYRIAGDYLCEVMTGFPVFDSDPRSMFLRLQAPVSFSK